MPTLNCPPCGGVVCDNGGTKLYALMVFWHEEYAVLIIYAKNGE
jgi:hypothetical protein